MVGICKAGQRLVESDHRAIKLIGRKRRRIFRNTKNSYVCVYKYYNNRDEDLSEGRLHSVKLITILARFY